MFSDSCLFIRHARILLPEGEFFEGDIQTRGREIVQIAPEIPASEAVAGDREIDATGLTLLPGVIAPQVHFRSTVAIAPGYDADLILVDLDNYHPVLREELQTKCGWSPFEGWNLTGWPIYTIVGGQVVYEKGQLNTAVRGRALTFN